MKKPRYTVIHLAGRGAIVYDDATGKVCAGVSAHGEAAGWTAVLAQHVCNVLNGGCRVATPFESRDYLANQVPIG